MMMKMTLYRFNVSKSVVREAIKILVSKGLLEVRRGNGTKVKPSLVGTFR